MSTQNSVRFQYGKTNHFECLNSIHLSHLQQTNTVYKVKQTRRTFAAFNWEYQKLYRFRLSTQTRSSITYNIFDFIYDILCTKTSAKVPQPEQLRAAIDGPDTSAPMHNSTQTTQEMLMILNSSGKLFPYRRIFIICFSTGISTSMVLVWVSVGVVHCQITAKKGHCNCVQKERTKEHLACILQPMRCERCKNDLHIFNDTI